MTMMHGDVGFSDGGSRGAVIPTGSDGLLTVVVNVLPFALCRVDVAVVLVIFRFSLSSFLSSSFSPVVIRDDTRIAGTI